MISYLIRQNNHIIFMSQFEAEIIVSRFMRRDRERMNYSGISTDVPFLNNLTSDNVQIVGKVCTTKSLPVQGAVEDLSELVEYLDKNELPLNRDQQFKRGTVTKDARLDLCKQGVGVEGARLVRQHLAKNTTIMHLLMGDDSLGVEGAKEVGHIIKENQSIKTIYLGCNNIAEEGTKHLVDAILEKNNINALWIKRNHINEGGAAHIGRLMSTNNSIQILDLISNDLQASAINTVTAAIRSNPLNCLTTLMLDSNHFGAQGAQYIADNILTSETSHARLLFLSLSNCNLLDEGCRIICEAFNRQSTIIDLDMSSNRLTPKSATYIGDMLAANKTLQGIDIGHSGATVVVGGEYNTFGADGVVYIIESVGNSQHPTLRSMDITFSARELTTEQKERALRIIQNKQFPISRIEGIIRMVGTHNIQFQKALQEKNKYVKMRIQASGSSSKTKSNNKSEDREAFTADFVKPIISVYRAVKDTKKAHTPKLLEKKEKIKHSIEKNDEKELSHIFVDQQSTTNQFSFTF
ncbi:hypothetical protein DFA_05493 [Cavenderia fasciculata]|uniref:Leucine-rich repeat-containing protein n=1 Tax=Cavenderia fasciculata TaxID=261658 RepID=F4PLD9_CACFS|nr:uncharacterized protein DFA_05493 [Cavenderia fasciculata]EGG23361.1 hypothetical protein DFA_05493 [Cavenderia fasciculata]|eukprot:XP_004361212.1 hypothetical protein DFA_05493 [Cavenderia fasciculata]